MPAFPIIKEVERIVLDVPFTPRCQKWNAREVWQWRIVEVLRVTTDSPDMIGYGETVLHYTWSRVSDEAAAKVIGKNPAEFLGDDSLGAGLQMAIYDLTAQALGVPVYRLFNLPRVREWCPISWWNIDMPPEEFAAEAVEAQEHGYTSYKFKARPWFDIYAQVEAVSMVSPRHFKLDIDWNCMLLNAGNASSVLQELDKQERIAIYESPIMQRDVEGHRILREKTTRPIALHFGEPPFTTVVRDRVCDGFVVGGGAASILRQGTLSAAFEKPFWLQMVGTGLTTAFSAHLGAVLPFAQWPSVNCMNNYADDLLAKPLTIKAGFIQVPTAPGLGIVINEDVFVKYKMEPPFEFPKPRLLLSIVWEGGRVMHYCSMRQVWDDCLAGNQPVQERGATMEVHADDNSSEWSELYNRTLKNPVLDQR